VNTAPESDSKTLPHGINNGGGVAATAVSSEPNLDAEFLNPCDVERSGAEGTIRIRAVADSCPRLPDSVELVIIEVDAVSEDRFVSQQS